MRALGKATQWTYSVTCLRISAAKFGLIFFPLNTKWFLLFQMSHVAKGKTTFHGMLAGVATLFWLPCSDGQTIHMISFGKENKIIHKEEMWEGWPTLRCLHWIPKLHTELLFYELTKKIHTQNKQVRRQWVTLSNPSRWENWIKSFPIKQNGNGHCRNTTHYNINQLLQKVHSNKHLPYKALLKLIISFLQVYLQSHVPYPSFFSSQ